MQYIKDYNSFTTINEKLVYDEGDKKHLKNNQTKDDLKRVGFMEVISVPDIGDFVAKFDSGNGSVSSIMCDKLEEDGDWVNWEINGIKMRSKKCGTSIVKNRNNEKRICIKLTVSFDGTTYKDVPFALTNRAHNYTKMLVNRTFVNTCHAMIDTSMPFICTKKPKNFTIKDYKNMYNGILFYKSNIDNEEE